MRSRFVSTLNIYMNTDTNVYSFTIFDDEFIDLTRLLKT